MNPMAPVVRNAACQPNLPAIQGTTRIVAVAPTFAPELKIPVATPRCRLGNHSATVLMQAGKFAASPNPSSTRARPNENAVVAAECIMAAALHNPTAIEIGRASFKE